MHVPHFISWNAAIRSHTADGRYREALMVFGQMWHAGLRPDCYAFAAVVKSCAAVSDAGSGRLMHGFAAKGSLGSTPAVEKALMDMYARFGMLDDSRQIFGEMGWRDAVSWNVLLSGYARSQLYAEAMGLLHSMHAYSAEEVRPNATTAAIILPVCAKLKSLKPGQNIHSYVVRTGLESETLVGNALVSMYAKCGSVTDDAVSVFHRITRKDVVSWNSMIAGYTDNGFFAEALDLFGRMTSMGFKPNYATVANVLPVCAFSEHGWHWGKEIHCHVLRSALEKDVSVFNSLTTHYARVGDLKEAEYVFRNMNMRDLVSWNALIAGYAMNGCHSRAMELFHELISMGLEPDSITLITVLPVCVQLRAIEEGRKIHDYVLRHPSLCKGTPLWNALVSFYGKCGELDDALQTFAGIPNRDLISWNSMLAAYADNDKGEELADLLYQMHEERIRPDSVTVLSVLQACAVLGTRKIREVHGYSIRTNLTDTSAVENAILDAYAKCGSIERAFRMFESSTERNVISCNTMISVSAKHGSLEDAEMIFGRMKDRDLATWNLMVQLYAQNGRVDRAISLFHGLQCHGMKPDEMSIMSFLPVCARLASVRLVRQCHGYSIRAFLEDLRLEGAFLDTYSKCGSIYDAQKLFRTSSQKDLVAFTAMVGSYATNGMAEEALGVFSQMLESNIKPDHVVMTALLSACSHAGLVNEGLEHFKSIDAVHGIKPTMEHYACAVDLLARRGRLREAYDFVTGMPCEPNANVWGTLLGACRTYGEAEIGRLAADHLFCIEAGNIGNYVVMSNIYAADARWDGVEEVRRLMKTKDLRKPAGCSWIEIERTRHVFVADDFSHPHRSFIYCMLGILIQEIKEPSMN